MMALVLGGASSLTLLNQFLHEEEGDRTHAYRDAGGVWTICKGLTHVDGNPVRKGMVLTPAQCDRLDREQEQKALALIDRIVNVPLTPPRRWVLRHSVRGILDWKNANTAPFCGN